MADVPWSSELELLQSIEDLQQEVMECHLQISDDFEELTLLREFAESLEFAESCGNPYHVAERILPALCSALKAEAVVLVVTGDGPGGDTTLMWSGPQTTDRETVLRLIGRFGTTAAGQPVVRNHIERDSPSEFPGLRELVLVHVAKGDRLLGWLLALNRSVGQELHGHAWPSLVGDFEFGTGQATLLSSVATMIAGHARNVEQFQEKERLLVNVVRALVSAIEAKDEYTCGHSERVALYSACLGRGLGLNELDFERLYLTGLVHDVGKIGIPDATLGKQAKLTDEEFEEIKQHPDTGWAILHDLDELGYVLPGVVHHHERYDGRGYPDGLVGENIPRDGRIVAIADAYDAMTSSRPYREGMPQKKAVAILQDAAGTQWDPLMVDTFLRVMPEILEIQRHYRRSKSEPRRPKQASPARQMSAPERDDAARL